MPLKVNRCRLNHVANLQQRATRRCSLSLIAAILPVLLLVPRKRGYGEKKTTTFFLICSNITLQCSTLIILYRVNFTLLPRSLFMVARACLHLFGLRRHKLSVVKTSVDFSFPNTPPKKNKNRQLGIAFDYYIIIICMEARSESNYAARNIQ